MELSEFRRRYNDAQSRLSNSLQAITVALEIVAASRPQRLHSINHTLQTINEYVPRVLNDYQDLTAIVDEFFNSLPPWNDPP